MNARKRNRLKKKWGKRLGIAAIAVFAVMLVTSGSLFAYYAKDLPSPDELIEREVSQTTKIYDRTGETVLYEIHGEENRTIVELDQIPEDVREATIAVEDQDFYNHHGFDVVGILRSVFTNVREGERASGGSTITQQLVKNAILTNEKTYERKIKELILSLEIERKFSKDEILQLYLNEIPYGSNAYGIESAARTFYGKSASELTLAESAYLASLPKAPTFYSPYGSHTEELDARMETVLDLMVEQGYVTQEQADDAKDDEVAFIESREDIIAPHFVFYVREKLVEKYGQKQVEQGGLKVITTLDLNKQRIAEEEVAKNVALIQRYGASNAALVSISPNSGEVLAMVGSIDYFNKEIEGNVNVTTRLRQAGSSFKPYAYAAAFEKGYTPQTKVFDLNTDFGNGYEPKNYDLSQNGPIALESALARSLNTPAVKVGYLVGPEKVAEFARNLGLSNLPEDGEYGLATPLGVREVQLLEHTNGFGVFANQGKYNAPTGVLKIEDARGKVLEENDPENKEVLDANIANTMNRILSTNSLRAPTFGTNNKLTLGSRPVAAKTGTTNDFKDALTVGYTPSIATGVWVGNNSGAVMSQGADGSIVAAPIWQGYMSRALEGAEVEQFVEPSPLPAPNATLQGKLEKGDTVAIDEPTGKLWTENCPAENKIEVTFGDVHNILHYINKDEPTGSAPSNPKADPQYDNWEGPISGWKSKNKFDGKEPPTETCDSAYANDAKISIYSPDSGETVSGTITIRASASSSVGVSKVEFFIDGVLIGSDSSSPYQRNFNTSNLDAGSHSITARLVDKNGEKITSSKVTVKTKAAAPDPDPVAPSDPSVSAVTSPTSDATQTLTGSKPAGTALYVNGVDVTGFTASTSWSYEASLDLGENIFTFYVRDSDGLQSGSVSTSITREP